jgi:ABC-type bacteriocin/lantibiotic exporter with double-glycine peptidase domain
MPLPPFEKINFLHAKDNSSFLTATPSTKIFLTSSQPNVSSQFLRKIISHGSQDNLVIEWNNKPIESDAIQDLQRRIIYCPQRTQLLPDTIKNIICCGIENEERLSEVLFITGLDEEMKRLSFGLETHVSINKKPLSGGQQQRIGLARSLFLEGDIYLLDHATSSLDKKSAETIWNRLFNSRNDTFIIVSHDDLSKDFCNIHVHVN